MRVEDIETGQRFGLWHVRDLLSYEEAVELAGLARWWCGEAPLARPTMGDGKGLKVRVTSMGDVGWWADRAGYRYINAHPVTCRPWPKMPLRLRLLAERAMRVVEAVGVDLGPRETAALFDTCLLNYYDDDASLGLHQDVTERDRTIPIVNISLGATARFEVIEGDPDDGGRVHRMSLESGDGVVMAGAARLAPHRIVSIDREQSLLSRSPLAAGRISLTFRRAREVDSDVGR